MTASLTGIAWRGARHQTVITTKFCRVGSVVFACMMSWGVLALATPPAVEAQLDTPEAITFSSCLDAAVARYGSLTQQQAVTQQAAVNVAAQVNGGVATASSGGGVDPKETLTGTVPAGGVNDGDRKGVNWGAGGGWSDGTPNEFPDWVQVAFNGAKTITEVDVFTLQDDYAMPAEVTEAMTFSLYGITDFEVQYWTGTDWATVPGGRIAGNRSVWRRVTFPPLTTDRIRISVTAALGGSSRVVEVEAWTARPTAASASSDTTVQITRETTGPDPIAVVTWDAIASLASCMSAHGYGGDRVQ